MTMVLGTLVGLPALRLSGLYLALITLMLAGAITVVLRADELPQRRPGLPRPHRGRRAATRRCAGPTSRSADPAYLRYAVVVADLMFLLALLARARAGRAARGRRSARASRRRSPRA